MSVTVVVPQHVGGEAPQEAQARARELAQVLEAYNEATERLQKSHQHLTTEVERLREQLASKDAQLQRSRRLAALGEMAAGIAHEIRNPLGAIGLYAGMLVEDIEASPQDPGHAGRREGMLRSARRIAEAVRGLDGIVNDVLSFARELQPRPRVLPVTELLSRSVEAYRPAIEAAGLEVHLPQWEPQDHSTVAIMGDPELMHQAMVNLVRNAVDAMEQSRRLPRVLTLDACRNGDRIHITVRDTGEGIAPDAVDRIFNPFFTTRSTGTGLGLAIVHRILDAHGGTITVRNDDGAVFELNLPAAESGVKTSAAMGGHRAGHAAGANASADGGYGVAA